MSERDVSFVTTVYNKKTYLPLVVASIRGQRGIEDAEYIFVDDGSTDGSYELLQQLTADMSNVKLIQKENGGQTSAFNVGLQNVTRSYIKLWDADDYAHPDLTQKLISLVKEHGTDLAFCRTDTSSFDRPEKIDEILAECDERPMMDGIVMPNHIKLVLKNPLMNPTGLLVTKKLIDTIGLVDERLAIPDVYVSYAATIQTKFSRIPGGYAYAFGDVPGRLTSNEAQILHDINGALYCFLERFGNAIPYRFRLYLGQRMTGRAWKWASRHNGKTPLSGDFWRFLKSRISPFPLAKAELYQTLLPFRQSEKPVRTKL